MFKNALDLADILGFKIRIDPSWLLIAALIVWSLANGYFPDELPGLSQLEYAALGTFSMFGLFASLILHELSHSLVARRYNLAISGITLFVFGGVAELEEEPKTPSSEFWVAIAGPIMSFCLAGSFYVLAALLSYLDISPTLIAVVDYLALINLILAIFNLVPAYPLDGGRIFRAALWAYKKDLLQATAIASVIGVGFGLFLVITGIFSIFSQNLIGGLWFILIGFFVISASRGSYQNLVTASLMKGINVNTLMSKNVYTAQITSSVQDVVDNIIIAKNVTFVPVLEGNHILGFVTLSMLQEIDVENRNLTLIGDIYAPKNVQNTVSSDELLEDVFKKMSSNGIRKLIVERDGQLAGVLTLSDMLTFLAIRGGLDQK
jgi:Zn-dependent protease/CBS domain-containing protein